MLVLLTDPPTTKAPRQCAGFSFSTLLVEGSMMPAASCHLTFEPKLKRYLHVDTCTSHLHVHSCTPHTQKHMRMQHTADTNQLLHWHWHWHWHWGWGTCTLELLLHLSPG